jgi:hypothetical protein
LVKPEFLILDSLYTFEPFIDVGNGIWDEGEPLVDIDNDGEWDDAEQYEVLDGNIIQFTDENGNGVWDDAEEFTDLGNGVWNPAEPYSDLNNDNSWDSGEPWEDINNDGYCGVDINYDDITGDDLNGDGFCDGEVCNDINSNGCDPNDQPYFEVNVNGMCDCPEPYTDLNDNGSFEPPEPLNDINGNGIWDGAEEYIDLNENGTWDVSILETIVDTVIYLNPLPEHDDYRITNGFRLQFQNEDNISFDEESSYWNNDSLWDFYVRTYVSSQGQGAALPNDYRVIFWKSRHTRVNVIVFQALGGTHVN